MNFWKHEIFFILLLTGCSNIQKQGVVDLSLYQTQRALISIGKDQLDYEFGQGDMSYEEYEVRRVTLSVHGTRSNVIESKLINITSKGRIRFSKNSSINKLIKGRSSSNSSLGLSLSSSRISLKWQFGKFKIEYKQKYFGDWKALFSFKLRF